MKERRGIKRREYEGKKGEKKKKKKPQKSKHIDHDFQTSLILTKFIFRTQLQVQCDVQFICSFRDSSYYFVHAKEDGQKHIQPAGKNKTGN
jgi:hypothetical protein